MLDGLVQQLIRDLGEDVLVELLAEQALEPLGQDVAEGEAVHGGHLGPDLAGDLGLLLAAEQSLVLHQQAVEILAADLAGLLRALTGYLLNRAHEHRRRPVRIAQPLQHLIGQVAQPGFRIEQQLSRGHVPNVGGRSARLADALGADQAREEPHFFQCLRCPARGLLRRQRRNESVELWRRHLPQHGVEQLIGRCGGGKIDQDVGQGRGGKVGQGMGQQANVVGLPFGRCLRANGLEHILHRPPQLGRVHRPPSLGVGQLGVERLGQLRCHRGEANTGKPLALDEMDHVRIADREPGDEHFLAHHLLTLADGDIALGVHGHRIDAGPFEAGGQGLGRFALAAQLGQDLDEIDAVGRGKGRVEGERMDLQPLHERHQSLDLRPGLVLVRELLAADHQPAFEQSQVDRVVPFGLHQVAQGLHDELIAALHLRVGGRVEADGPHRRVEPRREIEQESGSFR